MKKEFHISLVETEILRRQENGAEASIVARSCAYGNVCKEKLSFAYMPMTR